MKRLIIVLLTALLSGCPGGKPAPEHRSVFIQAGIICFSVNTTDILNHYNIYYSPKGKYTVLAAKDNIKLSYPKTCINVKLENGYQYNIYYGLNGKQYTDVFFIDKDGGL